MTEDKWIMKQNFNESSWFNSTHLFSPIENAVLEVYCLEFQVGLVEKSARDKLGTQN